VNDKGSFESGDPFDDPAWKSSDKPKRRREKNTRHVGCSVEWLGWAMSLARSQQQLVTALLLCRRCHVCNSPTVDVLPDDFDTMGIGRRSRDRHIQALGQVGFLTIGPRDGRRMRVTLAHWPDPPPA
jgi:hypothetical protein